MLARVFGRAKAILMTFELRQALSSRAFGRGSDVLLILLLSATIAVTARPVLASDVGDEPTAAQQERSAENRQPEGDQRATQNGRPKLSDPSTAPGLCEALATAATTNDLPLDFLTCLIWQESRFRPDAISRKGAEGIAQFMPTTARSSGLENPFNPLAAIAKSGQLLRGLRREFGNLGLAAAAYNAGPKRVRDWLGGQRPLPQETRAYVRFVTGRSVEEWAGSQAYPAVMPPAKAGRCNLLATALIQAKPDAATPRPQTVKPWGVQVVGGPTPVKALVRYRQWKSKYAAIIGDRGTHVVIRGILGQMGAALVRVGEDTRVGANQLCAALKAAGAYCDVLRN